MNPVAVGARTPRAPHPAAANGNAVAQQRQAFDFHLEEDAEMLRERNALADLLLAQLKNEDEILKKWIALI